MNAPAGLVWREFDQAGLDRQYNSRGTVPDFTVYTRRYTELTRAAKARLACIENLHYGPGADATLDLYPAAPAAGGPGTPVMVFFHGGDWRALSKDDSGFAAPAFVAAGVMFIAVNFSLVPALSIPQMGAQVRHALAWIARNVAAHGGDAARLHVAGHSSGANLVGQLLATDWVRDFDLPADLVKGATFMSGLGDLEPVRRSFRNAHLKLDDAMVAAASLLQAAPGAACPLIVAFGEHEMPEYRRQGREVAAFWRTRGRRADVFELAGRNHFDAVLEWADPASALLHANLAAIGLAAPAPGL